MLSLYLLVWRPFWSGLSQAGLTHFGRRGSSTPQREWIANPMKARDAAWPGNASAHLPVGHADVINSAGASGGAAVPPAPPSPSADTAGDEAVASDWGSPSSKVGTALRVAPGGPGKPSVPFRLRQLRPSLLRSPASTSSSAPSGVAGGGHVEGEGSVGGSRPPSALLD